MKYLAACTLVVTVSLIGCEQSDLSSTDATPVAFNATGAPTIEFSVPDMMCPDGCGLKTKEILSQQPGAKEVVVNFEAKSATVAIEADKFDSDAALAALVDHGFEHSTVNQVKAQEPAPESASTASDAANPSG